MGPSGTGKTSSIRSWIANGFEVRALFTEPSFEVVADIKCTDGFHYKYLSPINPSWDALIDSAKKINSFNVQALSSLADVNKSQYKGFIEVAQNCNKFVCDRCGKDFGSVDTWPESVVFFLDSMSGLSDMAMALQVGSKPMKSQADWGIAMDALKIFTKKLATSLKCHFVLTAHVDKERDLTTGLEQIMVATLGRKLAPELPLWFSDVVLTRRSGTTFEWSTAATGTDLKARNFPFADKLPADITPALQIWASRGGILPQPKGAS